MADFPLVLVLVAFQAAWHAVFGSKEIGTSDIHEACRIGTKEPESTLAATVADLDIAAPRGQAVVNTRSLGTWLSRFRNRPGEYVLRKSESRERYWYVEQTAAVVAETAPGDGQQVYIDMLRDWCQRKAAPDHPAPLPGTGDPIPDGLETADLRCRLDHAPKAGDTVTLCDPERWPLARLRVAEGIEPPQPGAEWAAVAVEPWSDADLLRDGGAPESGAGTWWRAKVHRVHIVQAVKRKGKVWIVDQDVVMLYRRGADDADRETPDLFEGNGKAPLRAPTCPPWRATETASR